MMISQSLSPLLKQTAPEKFVLHNNSGKLFLKLIPLLGIATIVVAEILNYINAPLIFALPVGILFTWVPIILLFLNRSNQGSIGFDGLQNYLTVYSRSGKKEFRNIPFDQIIMRYEALKGSKKPDCIDFCISSEKEPLYRLYLDSKQQWMYDEVLYFVREFTKGQIKEEIADIKVHSGSLDLAFGILITLGFFFTFAAILFGTPFFVAWFFNTGFAGGIMTLLFLFMLLIAMNCKLGMQSKKWPSVNGRIVSSAIDENRTSSSSGNSSSTKWEPHLEYSYFVNGREYRCKTLAFYDISFLKFEEGTRYIAQYPAGTIVPVYYNPKRPVIATLITGIDKSSLVISILLGTGALVAAFFAFNQWQGMKWERFADDAPVLYEIARKFFIKQ